MTIRFDDRVALVTGAGNGLGKSHALALAARGATVVVNDLGGMRDGSGGSPAAAQAVADEIIAAGGTALADGTDITNADAVLALIDKIMQAYGRLDIVVNNAGILRDKSFVKMTVEDFDAVINVHLRGSFLVTHAAWPIMRDQNYGRVVFTTSSSGLYGNFGQANYGAAKMGVLGLMTTLSIEGAKYDIRVNCLAPTALTRMTEDLNFPANIGEMLTPQSVTPGLLYLVGEDAPHRTTLAAGAGGYAVSRITESDGIWLPEADRSPEAIAARFDELSNPEGAHEYDQGGKQSMNFLQKAMAGTS